MRIKLLDITPVGDIVQVYLRFEQESHPYNSANPVAEFSKDYSEKFTPDELASLAAIQLLPNVVTCFDAVGWAEGEEKEIRNLEGATWSPPIVTTMTIMGLDIINLKENNGFVSYSVYAEDQYGRHIVAREESLTWNNQVISPSKVGELTVSVSNGNITASKTVNVIDEIIPVNEPSGSSTDKDAEIALLKGQVSNLTAQVENITLAMADILAGGAKV